MNPASLQNLLYLSTVRSEKKYGDYEVSKELLNKVEILFKKSPGVRHSVKELCIELNINPRAVRVAVNRLVEQDIVEIVENSRPRRYTLNID